MDEKLQSLWNDEYFTIETGVIPGRPRLSGADLGPGIIYYPVDIHLDYGLAGNILPIPDRRRTPTGLNVLWNAGSATEIFNPEATRSEFFRVALKPSAPVMAEIPEQFVGLAYASLLQADWVQPFKDSVGDDLDVIGAFVEQLRRGQRDVALSQIERVVAAKEDLDLKLIWSAARHQLRDVFTIEKSGTILAAAAATGAINVTANTVDAAQSPVQGCVVWYVAFINKNNSASYNSFSRLSTPTSGPLAVGNYEMWAGKGGKTGQKRKVSINSASGTQIVDVFAP